MIVPTRRFWLLVALGVPIAAYGAVAGSPFLILFYNLMLAAIAIITGRLGPTPLKIRVTRQFDPVLSVRANNVVRLRIHNDNLEPVKGRIRDEMPPDFQSSIVEFPIEIGPEREANFRIITSPKERGGDYFRGSWVRLQCPLGLVERQAKLPTEQPVRVYPNVLALREFDLLKQRGRLREMGIRRTRIRGLGTDFESLRDYADGDDFRKIDWKGTARRGKLIVRQFEQERNQSVIIVLDIGRHMLAEVDGVRKIDRALDAILMLAHAVVNAGDFIGLLVYSDTVRRYLPPRKGRAQLGAVIEAVHDLIAEPVESDPAAAFAYLQSRWKRRSLIVFFTDLEDEARATTLVTALGSAARRHLLLMSRVADPKLKEAVKTPIVDPPSMYRRSAALLLVSDRRAGTARLNASGVHNIESEPEELASDLVNYYFTVKEKSLL
jgi:uncharacterized protein (DUF58 family)